MIDIFETLAEITKPDYMKPPKEKIELWRELATAYLNDQKFLYKGLSPEGKVSALETIVIALFEVKERYTWFKIEKAKEANAELVDAYNEELSEKKAEIIELKERIERLEKQLADAYK